MTAFNHSRSVLFFFQRSKFTSFFHLNRWVDLIEKIRPVVGHGAKMCIRLFWNCIIAPWMEREEDCDCSSSFCPRSNNLHSTVLKLCHRIVGGRNVTFATYKCSFPSPTKQGEGSSTQDVISLHCRRYICFLLLLSAIMCMEYLATLLSHRGRKECFYHRQ